jgi:hypothetical protein
LASFMFQFPFYLVICNMMEPVRFSTDAIEQSLFVSTKISVTEMVQFSVTWWIWTACMLLFVNLSLKRNAPYSHFIFTKRI